MGKWGASAQASAGPRDTAPNVQPIADPIDSLRTPAALESFAFEVIQERNVSVDSVVNLVGSQDLERVSAAIAVPVGFRVDPSPRVAERPSEAVSGGSRRIARPPNSGGITNDRS